MYASLILGLARTTVAVAALSTSPTINRGWTEGSTRSGGILIELRMRSILTASNARALSCSPSSSVTATGPLRALPGSSFSSSSGDCSISFSSSSISPYDTISSLCPYLAATPSSSLATSSSYSLFSLTSSPSSDVALLFPLFLVVDDLDMLSAIKVVLSPPATYWLVPSEDARLISIFIMVDSLGMNLDAMTPATSSRVRPNASEMRSFE
mmetsp:Transcript_20477/g.41726  ORF Transcript_20477/g.41726 Transcript_20477/m.41726 type:complete len:211 (-) Transcript_20477:57-689(-)